MTLTPDEQRLRERLARYGSLNTDDSWMALDIIAAERERAEKLKQRLSAQTNQTQITAQQKHDAVVDVLRRHQAIPEGIDPDGHPVEQVVGTCVSWLKCRIEEERERAAKAEHERDRAIEREEYANTVIEDINKSLDTLADNYEAATRREEKAEAAFRSLSRTSLANNLCPDHRDKQAGKTCLACEVERLERRTGEQAARIAALEAENATLREAAKQTYHVLSLDARVGIPGSMAFEARKFIEPVVYPQPQEPIDPYGPMPGSEDEGNLSEGGK